MDSLGYTVVGVPEPVNVPVGAKGSGLLMFNDLGYGWEVVSLFGFFSPLLTHRIWEISIGTACDAVAAIEIARGWLESALSRSVRITWLKPEHQALDPLIANRFEFERSAS
jgi:hypothetical protein